MSRIGRYEIVGEISSSPVGLLARARAAGSPKEFAVKLFRPDPIFIDPQVAGGLIRRFLNRARLQQQVAEGQRGWAKIYECDATPGGAFYATDCFASSAARLVSGRVAMTDPSLHALLSTVA